MIRSSLLTTAALLSAMALIAVSSLLLGQVAPPTMTTPAADSTSAPATQPAKATAAEIEKSIRDLRSDYPKTREHAAVRLWELGPAARPALLKAAKDTDAEVATRAAGVLEKFALGIYADTPPEAVDLAKQFHDIERALPGGGQESSDKANVINQLIAIGPKAYRTVTALAMRESSWQNLMTNQYYQAPYAFANVHREVVRDAPTLIAKGDLEGAQALLEKGAACGYDRAIRSYADFLAMTGKLDEKIKALEPSADPLDRRTLAYFYRAKGELPKAFAAAKESDDELLKIALAAECRQWKEFEKLVQDQPTDGCTDATKSFTLSCHRLAGNQKEFKALAKELADSRVLGSAPYPIYKALAFNDLPGETIELLKNNGMYGDAYDLLVAQMNYAKAFDLLEKASKDDLPQMQIEQGRILYTLGQKEGAATYLAKMFERYMTKPITTDHSDFPIMEGIVATEGRLGLTKQALRHVNDLLSSQYGIILQDHSALAGAAFPRQREEVSVWWLILGWEHSQTTIKEQLDRLQSILEGKTPAKVVLSLARKHMKAVKEGAEKVGLARTCRRLGDLDLAIQCLEATTATPDTDYLQLTAAMWLGEAKRWKGAAAKYAELISLQPHRAMLYYRQGYALTQAGEAAEGKKLIDLSDRMALADDYARMELASSADLFEQHDQARAQRQWLIRSGEVFGLFRAQACASETASYRQKKDFEAEINYMEQYRLELALPDMTVSNKATYLQMMRDVHLAKMHVALVAGEFDEAVKEWQVAAKALPQDSGAAIYLVPALREAGRKEQADKVYAAQWDFYQSILKEYPNNASMLNLQAWLAARCRTGLDEALKLAQRAVAMEPENLAFLDTLAEVQFQFGHQKEALDMMKKCIELDARQPSHHGEYYRSQLKRFEANDPATNPQEDPSDVED